MKNENKKCLATHPDKPNFSGHARGRKLHLTKNNERTFCNMLIDEIAEDKLWLPHFKGRNCKICFQGKRKEIE
jgi:hypothetical protein